MTVWPIRRGTGTGKSPGTRERVSTCGSCHGATFRLAPRARLGQNPRLPLLEFYDETTSLYSLDRPCRPTAAPRRSGDGWNGGRPPPPPPPPPPRPTPPAAAARPGT